MRAARRLLIALALGLLAGAATMARAAPLPADAAPDQDAQAPPAEPRIDQPFGHAWLGAADGDVTLVVFADYACPACRTAQAVIDQLLAQDRRLKVVYRLLDNDQGGRAAALTSLAVAAARRGLGPFHHALDAAADLTPTTLAAALAASGADKASLPPLATEDDPATAALAEELSPQRRADHPAPGDGAAVLGDRGWPGTAGVRLGAAGGGGGEGAGGGGAGK